MSVYQSGDGAPPSLLLRFRSAVGDIGLIHGPSRGRLYQWHSRKHGVVDTVGGLLWPWLGEQKRAQFARAAAEVHRTPPATADAQWSEDELAAWAAGFFDGEGTVGVYGDAQHPYVSMSLPQAARSGVPSTLERFRVAVGAGAVSGPRAIPSQWSKLPQYRWQVASFDEIARVIEILRPHADVVKLRKMDASLARVREARARRLI